MTHLPIILASNATYNNEIRKRQQSQKIAKILYVAANPFLTFSNVRNVAHAQIVPHTSRSKKQYTPIHVRFLIYYVNI